MSCPLFFFARPMDGKSCGAKYKNVILADMLLLFERSNPKMIGIGSSLLSFLSSSARFVSRYGYGGIVVEGFSFLFGFFFFQGFQGV